FDAKRPGVVLARTHSDAEPVSFQLLGDPEVLPRRLCSCPACTWTGHGQADLGLSVPMKRRTLYDQHHKAQHRIAHSRG
ncbi:hypothetical protein XENORESO_019220, partial [Xenotaenia resolanae]